MALTRMPLDAAHQHLDEPGSSDLSLQSLRSEDLPESDISRDGACEDHPTRACHAQRLRQRTTTVRTFGQVIERPEHDGRIEGVDRVRKFTRIRNIDWTRLNSSGPCAERVDSRVPSAKTPP